jgi:Protein of unknown function (DUF732)
MPNPVSTTGRRWGLVAVAAAAVAALLGFVFWPDGTGNHPGGAYPTGRVPSPASASPAPLLSAPSGPPAATGGTRATDPANQAATGFLEELGAIDPGLVTDPDRALAGGRATCQDLAAHQPDDVVISGVIQRFHTGGVPVDRPKAALIVDAARNHLCP